MKVELNEYGTCFEIALTPETLEDAAKLIRLGINGTREVRNVFAFASSDKTISGGVTIGKRKKPASKVVAGGW